MIPRTDLLYEENSHDQPNHCHATEARMQTRIPRRTQTTFSAGGHQGEGSFEQAEVIAAQLLRIPLEADSLVVLDLAEL
jgi:hypothetical protein